MTIPRSLGSEMNIWHLRKARHRIENRNGYWLIVDGSNVVGEFGTRTEARIARRKMEVGKQ